MKFYLKLLILILFYGYSYLPKVVFAENLPKLVSIKTSKANLRYGPGKNYPIKIIFIKKNIPLLVIDKFDHWRKILTSKNTVGWIHKSQLTMKLRSIILKPDYLRKKPQLLSQKIAFLYNDVNVSVVKCKVYWCKITLKTGKFSGWYIKKFLWGSNYIIVD
tara:strand:- start:274 stop:756 length:483 start_codon:yes stop_codon:yes gene_type:complete